MTFFESKDGDRAILEFRKIAYMTIASMPVGTFGENCFVDEEITNICRIQDGGRRHLYFWEIYVSDPGDRQVLVSRAV